MRVMISKYNIKNNTLIIYFCVLCLFALIVTVLGLADFV